jgi:hypothetical protein
LSFVRVPSQPWADGRLLQSDTGDHRGVCSFVL